jgi:hypothetical protein
MAPTTAPAKFVHNGWAEIGGGAKTMSRIKVSPVRLRPPPGKAAEIAMASAAYWQARHSS